MSSEVYDGTTAEWRGFALVPRDASSDADLPKIPQRHFASAASLIGVSLIFTKLQKLLMTLMDI